MHNQTSLASLLEEHMQLYPFMGAQDIYKLLYQGHMGPRHLLGNPERARNYLYEEWERVPADAEAPLLAPVSADGSVVRIHIAPAKAHNIQPGVVWNMLYRTANSFRENKTTFLADWRSIPLLIAEGALDQNPAAWSELDQEAAGRDYPPMHHSPAYRQAYFPAYRVIYFQEYTSIDTQNKE